MNCLINSIESSSERISALFHITIALCRFSLLSLHNYDGNRITSITGSVSAAYTYDSNGNMAGDGRENLQMQYNLINLPQTVNQGSVSKARYIWLSDGTKASVVADTLSNNGYTYLGSMVYSRSGSNHTLESVSFGQGRIVHSGSVRVITTPTGTIAEQNDYYPFGERTNLGQQYQQLSTNRNKYIKHFDPNSKQNLVSS